MSKAQEIIDKARLYRDANGLAKHNDGTSAKGTPVEFAYEELDKLLREVVAEDENVFWKYTNRDGVEEEHVDEERALGRLLLDGVLFCNEREYVDYDFKTQEGGSGIEWDKTKPHTNEATTILFVNCNDLFYWGTADAEVLPNSEIGNLLRMHLDPANKGWGSSMWCCFRRKLRPQVPVIEDMKKDGVWNDALEALPAPQPS